MPLITGLVKLEPLKGFQNGAKRVEIALNRNSCPHRFDFCLGIMPSNAMIEHTPKN